MIATAAARINRVSSGGGSPLGYFSDADVERYLELQRTVKSACSRAAAGYVPVAEAGRFLQVEENEVPTLIRGEEELVKSAEMDGGGDGGSGRGKVRQRRSAVAESTIASRSKMRPEPKFQRVVTSQVLSQMRKDSRLITRNPTRFLDAIVDSHQQQQQQISQEDPVAPSTHTFASYLTNFTTQAASQSYQQALENLRFKCRQAKSRTLLLNLGGSTSGGHPPPLIQNKSSRASSATFDTFLNSNGGGDGGGTPPSRASSSSSASPWDYSRGDADLILQSYLDDIRSANVTNLKIWVETPATINEMELPFGLPNSSGILKIPTKNLDQISSAQSQEFVQSAIEEFFLLDAEYHAKLEELSSKITDNFRELELAAWPGRNSALLFHLMTTTSQSKSYQHFSSEKLCTEVATRLFRGWHSKDDVIGQKYRLKVKKALEEKRESVIKHWLIDKDKLVKKVNTAWDDIQRQEERKEEWSREKKVQQEKCQYWMDLLERMRKENRKKVRTITAMVEPLEEQLRRQQKVKEEQERSRRQEQKELLEKFHRIRVENEEEEKRNREEIQMKLEKDRKRRQIQNRARVHLRREQYFEKKEGEREMERRKEEERREREAILERTKEKVEIDYNPWSVLSDTHASLVRSHEIQQLIKWKDGGAGEEEEGMRRFFQERYSFSAETLWKDSRVRLEAKLREAGLIGNSYARQVLMAMQPKEKPHLQSQIKFDEQDN